METLRQRLLPGEEGEVKCLVCGKEGKSDLCSHHEAARARVRGTYQLWVKAYGAIGWTEYLDNVIRNVQTGQWAKEVAEFLRGV